MRAQRTQLRRTIRPYVGQTLILAGVGAFCLAAAVKTGEWGLVWVQPLIWFPFVPLVLIGLRYRVAYDDEGIYQQASGGRPLFIPYTRLTKVECETSAGSELLRADRPFRRIAFYGDQGETRIDVSLRHFARDDIRGLLAAVRGRRPEFEVALPREF